MNKFEFISLKDFPEGQYPTSIATVRINLKDDKGYPVREVLRYAKKTMKDGGTFWAMATHSVVVNGEKKYLPGYKLDSELDEEMLIDFIKENVKRLSNPIQMTGQIQYPYANQVQPTSMSEIATEQEIPF